MRLHLEAKGERATSRVDMIVAMGIPADKFLDVDWCLYLPAGELLWADLLAHLGVFRSKSQARKAGWNQLILEGLSEVVVGKLRHQISVVNLTGGGQCLSS